MALKFLNETGQRLLDGQLQSILQTLTRQPPGPDGTTVGEARGIIESQVGKLVRQSWEETWESGFIKGGVRKGFVASAWFEAKHKEDAAGKINRVPEFEKESDELYTVFTRLVAYVKETDPDDRQDAATDLIKALRRYLRLRGYNEAAAATHPDGPEGGCWLWWQNTRHDIPKGVVYRLLEFMWQRESARYNALEDAGVFRSNVAPQTVRSYANKVNNALPAGIPWRLASDSVNRQLTKVPHQKRVTGIPQNP